MTAFGIFVFLTSQNEFTGIIFLRSYPLLWTETCSLNEKAILTTLDGQNVEEEDCEENCRGWDDSGFCRKYWAKKCRTGSYGWLHSEFTELSFKKYWVGGFLDCFHSCCLSCLFKCFKQQVLVSKSITQTLVRTFELLKF